MTPIKILPKEIIAKIAAGEVIERPVSVVKELVENALDAEAQNIQIELLDSGLKQIIVTDDGLGMDEANLRQCVKPHATSKLNQESDLARITSLGFRGEALASIAAVSQLVIKSRLKGQPKGAKIILNAKKPSKVTPTGMPEGTQVIVNTLFKTTPARKKFIKNPRTEYSQILQMLNRMALAFPQIGFSLKHNQRLIFTLPANQDLKTRMKLLLGKKIADHLLPFAVTSRYGNIEGMLSDPLISGKSTSKQYIFINSRQIRNLTLNLAVREAYGHTLAEKAQPVFILAFNLPPETVDVNIHPRKEEVKFLHQAEIIALLKKSIKAQLAGQTKKFEFNSRKMDQNAANLLKELNASEALGAEKEKDSSILQIKKTYLVAPTPKSLLIIDQHAAHERILFEEMKKLIQTTRKKQPSYQLKKPLILELDIITSALLENYLPALKKLGFSLETFGQNSFKVTAVPYFFQDRNLTALLNEILEDLQEEKPVADLDAKLEKTITYLSCRGAVKAGDYLNQKERKELLQKLLKTQNPFTCPHGRPLIVEFNKADLEKMFKR